MYLSGGEDEMKRMVIILVILVLLLAGCGKEGSKVEEAENNGDIGKENEIDDSQGEEGFVFEYEGIRIPISSKAELSLKDLGKEVDYYQAESCAFQGLDKIYTYNNFELHTYEIDGVDHVYSIVFLDDIISTPEGISLGSSLEDLIDAYGEDYTQELGLYTYELDKVKLAFIIENDEVSSIEYSAVTE